MLDVLFIAIVALITFIIAVVAPAVAELNYLRKQLKGHDTAAWYCKYWGVGNKVGNTYSRRRAYCPKCNPGAYEVFGPYEP